MEDPYVVLGVEHDATVEDIEEAFRRKARTSHPDRVAHLDRDAVAEATAEMARTEEARHLLLDPLWRARHRAPPPAAGPASRSHRDRPPTVPPVEAGGTLRERVRDALAGSGIRGVRGGGDRIFMGREQRPAPGLLATRGVHGAILTEAHLTTADIATIVANPDLRALNLQSTFVGDHEVELLSTMSDLVHLDLDDTRITDRASAALAAAPRLDNLALNETAVTDTGMEALGRSRSLRSLELRRTAVTAAGLARLDQVPLRFLVLPPRIRRRERQRLEDVHPGITLL